MPTQVKRDRKQIITETLNIVILAGSPIGAELLVIFEGCIRLIVAWEFVVKMKRTINKKFNLFFARFE